MFLVFFQPAIDVEMSWKFPPHPPRLDDGEGVNPRPTIEAWLSPVENQSSSQPTFFGSLQL